MELVDGVDLAEWMQQHPRTDPERRERGLDYVVQAAEGLAAVHGAGVVHRDFKPGNLLLGADGRVRVADFGFARIEPHETVTFERPGNGARPSVGEDTGTGIILGTPRYMAPEQAAGKGVDASADQFAFCVTAWELLWGRYPWAKGHPGSGPLLEPPDADPALLKCLRQGLREDPAARHPSMESLVSRLRELAAAATTVTPPVGRRRRPAGIALAGIAVLGIGAIVIALMDSDMPRSQDDEAPDRQSSVEALASPSTPVSTAAPSAPAPEPAEPEAPTPTRPASDPDPAPARQIRRAPSEPGPDSRVRAKATKRAAHRCAQEAGPSRIEIQFLIQDDGRPALLRSTPAGHPRAACSEKVLRATRFRRGSERRAELTVTFED